VSMHLNKGHVQFNSRPRLVKFVVPYCSSEGEYLVVLTEEDIEYDRKSRDNNGKYYTLNATKCMYTTIISTFSLTCRINSSEITITTLWHFL